MSGNRERGRGLRRREKNATEAGAGRYEKPAPDTRAAPPQAHESLIGRKTVEEVPLTGLSFSSNCTKVGESLRDIADKIAAADGLVADIAAAAGAEESARAAEELTAHAESLNDLVGTLRRLTGDGSLAA